MTLTRFSAGLAIVVILAFTALGWNRFHPFRENVTPQRAAGDDWLEYRQNAQSIVDDGLLIQRIKVNYQRPGGFLYNYFIAAIIAMAGVSGAVYFVQAALLGVTVAASWYWLARPLLSPVGSLAYLILLTGALRLDQWKYYTARLLSENLLLFLVPLIVMSMARLIERPGLRWAAAAGIVAGVAVLARPNTILIGPAALVAALFVSRRALEPKQKAAIAAMFFAAWGLAISPIYIRNYAVTREISFAALTTRHDWARPQVTQRPSPAERARASLSYYGRRGLLVLGFGSPRTNIRPRPHWVAFWAGAAILLVLGLRNRRRWAPLEIASLVFLLFYLAPLMAVGHIENYGFRMMVPMIPPLLLLALRGLQSIHAERSLNPS